MDILIIKTSSLGDIIQSFDLLFYLKKKIPYANVDWVSEKRNESLLKLNPDIRKIYTIESKNLKKDVRSFFKELKEFKKIPRYDLVFDLQGNCKSAIYLFFVSSKTKIGFARRDLPEWPNMFFTSYKVPLMNQMNIRQDYLFLAQSYFQDYFTPLRKIEKKNRSYTLLAPFSRWPSKELRFSEIDLLLKKKKIDDFYLVYKGEEEKKKALDLLSYLKKGQLLEEMTLSDLSFVIKQAELAICADSMILHLAAYLGCPTISIFTASSSKKYAPVGPEHISYQIKCRNPGFEKRCKNLRRCQKCWSRLSAASTLF